MNNFKLYLIGLIIKFIPETRLFGLKCFLYRSAGVKIGSNVRICSSVRILGSGELTIGDNTWIGHDTLIISSSKIQIEANVDIAPRTYIGTGTHTIDPELPNIAGKGISKDIFIGNGCWLCVNCTILPGVKIGNKSVIAAGALVNTNVDSKTLMGGVPAKKIKKL